jgi:oligosaccharide repeat unit polymerase
MEIKILKLNFNLDKVDIFSPYIIVVVIALYVALAILGYTYHIRDLQWASINTFLYVIFGTILFIIGATIPKLITHYTPSIKSAFNRGNIKKEKSIFCYSKLKILLDERILLSIVIIALILQGINLYLLGGIPLLNGYLKFKATTDLWRISYIIFLPALNLLIAKYPRRWYYLLFIIGLGLFAINGYRTTTLAIIFSVIITTYYILRIKTRYIILSILIAFLIGILLGYIAVKSIQWQTWVLNPLQLLFYRAGFTMMILDKIVHMPGFTGGELFHQALTGGHPRVTVQQVTLPGYSQPISITSTIFGPAILDFGALGLAVQMLLLGLILRLMHSAQKIANGAYTAIYAIILAHTMIWVETGPTDSIVWIFYVIAVIALLIFATRIFRGDLKLETLE